MSDTEVWAQGYVPPGGDVGVGDYAVLHSRNGGKTWSELPWTYAHNEPSPYSFVDAKTGIIARFDLPEDMTTLMRTRDAGAHWAPIPKAEVAGSLRTLQLFPTAAAYMVVGDMNQDEFWRKETSTGERHKVGLTEAPSFIGAMFFLDPDTGWLAGEMHPGPQGSAERVLHTTDAGAHWSSADVPVDVAKTAGVWDLWFQNRDKGWLVTEEFDDGGTDIWQTSDGGKTWESANPVLSHHWTNFVRFIDDRHGFAASGNLLFYTTDGGSNWQSKKLSEDVQSCEVHGHGLKCAAYREKQSGEFDVLTIELN
jgi:photosystem II stability/assembly factor-like uncharacterized protein